MVYPEFIRAFWYMSNNFGDNLNFDVIRLLSGKEPVYTDDRNKPHLICCGSILTEANAFTTVYGAGFAWEHDNVHPAVKTVCVRGELSASKCKDVKIIGDPALLMPLIYNPAIEATHEAGIIPHWKDAEMLYWIKTQRPDIKNINPLQPIRSLIDEIKSCHKILSSSLHGLILSDAYRVENKWLDFGNSIGGDGFKFRDYYSSTKSKSYQRALSLSTDGCQVNEYKYSLQDLINHFPK